MLTLAACKKEALELYIPSKSFFYVNASNSFSHNTRKAAEGIYTVKKGIDFLGSQVVIIWSCNYFSIFTGSNTVYLVCKPIVKDSAIAFEGYWKSAQKTNSGKVFLNISTTEGATELLNGNRQKSIVIGGFYGQNNENPLNELVLEFDHPIRTSGEKFWIIAHRGGGRNLDNLAASENSLDIIKSAEAFGANSIEIDVQQTKDSIPVLFHDEKMSKRLINEDLFIGKISDYTFPQLRTFCTLKDGQKIPTLKEALQLIVDSTELNLVWLDMKGNGMMNRVADIQEFYIDYAKTKSRELEIIIGLPDEKMLKEYLNLTDMSNHPALCEFYDDTLITTKSIIIWSPRWSLGLQDENVKSIHELNKRAFVWTIDQSNLIIKYLNKSSFDGILSNYPSVVAYEYYSK